jgi:cytochrome c-type biogenesis protein CcmE
MEEQHTQVELDAARSKRGRIRMVVGLVIAVTAFYIFIAGATEGGVYFYEVDEALDQKADEVVGRMVRIKGNVVEGTWTQRMAPHTINEFRIEKIGALGRSIAIYYPRPIPDVFKEGGEVVVTGSFDKNQVLRADEVTAKCPSKYEGKEAYPGMEQETKTKVE